MLEVLEQSTTLSAIAAFVLGLLIGSFLNVVIHRLPKMLESDWQRQAAEARGEILPVASPYNLMVPRSSCPACGHRIGALENIPVVSWLMLRGRCSACGARISIRYPLIELLTASSCALAVAFFGPTLMGLAAMALTCILIALAFIDFDTQLLPDSLTLSLMWIGLLLNVKGVFAPLEAAVLGAALGYLLLWSVYWVFKLVTGKEGMGYGDFKLLAALGAWFGWSALPAIILLASVVGATIGIGLVLLARHGREVPIPFGPYLAGAGLLTLYFRTPLANLFGLA
ncbi:MAG: prepilin peptidase [Burkholderiaceae bacterium]|nr:prepilin peptidase [Burkholderiaceae bacterium]